MKKTKAFVLVETIAVSSIFVTVSLIVGDLLLSSCKMAVRAEESYRRQTLKAAAVAALYAGDFENFSAGSTVTEDAKTHSRTIHITAPDKTGVAKETIDVVWKK